MADHTGMSSSVERLRVGLVLEQSLAPVPGGTGRYSTQVAAALAQEERVQVTGWTAWHRDVRGARVAGVGGPRRLVLPRRPLILAWERGVGPSPRRADVVHAPTLLVPPRAGRPLVVTIHDVVPWTHPQMLTPRGVRWHRGMAARAASVADRVVVPTRAVAEQLQRHVPLSRPPEVVGLGVTPLPLPVDADRRADALGLPADGYVVSVATVEPRKGLDVLLRAMAHPEAPDLRVVVVGPGGWGGVSVADLAARAGLATDRVAQLGRIPDRDLAVVLDRATVAAVPSRAEGFGLPVVEAMAAGVPVVTSDDPALVEVGGGAALVAPVGDVAATARALRQASGEGAVRERCIRAGLARASDFTWAATAAGLVAVYQGVV